MTKQAEYRVERVYNGIYEVHDSEGRLCRVAVFQPGSMVCIDGMRILPPAAARVLAQAIVSCADDAEDR